MVLTYDLSIYSEGIRRDYALFPIYPIKIWNNINKVQSVRSNLFVKYTTRTHSLSKKNQYTKHYT